jgi:hypothetical protein
MPGTNLPRLGAALLAMGLAVSTPWDVFAGTKYLANLVPVSASPPTLAETSKVIALSNGKLKATLKGVLDSSGQPVTTDGSFTSSGTLTGDEYVTILSGIFVDLNVAFEFVLVAELKKGNGTAKVDASDLFGLIPPGNLRSVQITTTETYGPLGAANVAACSALLAAGGFNLPPVPNPCIGGSRIGVAGFAIP